VHDTYFVVAHFHYVLVGGMVFPFFAAICYWIPAFSPRPLSERLGKWAFALMFIGFNVAFFTMHLTGLSGMPRRVYTYLPELGWGPLNFISSIGAFTLAAGVAIVFFDILRKFRIGHEERVGNVWNAGTLEWLPNDTFATRSIPIVRSREPLWDQPNMPRDVEEGRYYLPGTATGGRETIVTSAIEAHPQFIVQMPGPSWTHVLAAVLTALCFFSLTLKLVIPAIICAALAIACIVVWMWEMDPGPGKGPVDVGGGLKLPVYATGPKSHSWWAMIVLILVAATLYVSYFFSYVYLWTVAPEAWADATSLIPDLGWPLASGALLVLSSLLMLTARKLLRPPRAGFPPLLVAAVGGALACLNASLAIEIGGQWQAGLRADENSYAALTFLNAGLWGELVAALTAMGAFTIARAATGRLDVERRATFDNTALLWHYAVLQGLFGLLLVHGFPRLVG
jgi:cytochrome c oxidase subunit I+III